MKEGLMSGADIVDTKHKVVFDETGTEPAEEIPFVAAPIAPPPSGLDPPPPVVAQSVANAVRKSRDDLGAAHQLAAASSAPADRCISLIAHAEQVQYVLWSDVATGSVEHFVCVLAPMQSSPWSGSNLWVYLMMFFCLHNRGMFL